MRVATLSAPPASVLRKRRLCASLRLVMSAERDPKHCHHGRSPAAVRGDGLEAVVSWWWPRRSAYTPQIFRVYLSLTQCLMSVTSQFLFFFFLKKKCYPFHYCYRL